MGIQEDLGRRVAELRTRAGLTQAALAERIGVAPETISRLERGSSVPSLARVEQLAGALGTPVASLFAVEERGSKRAAAVAAMMSLVTNRTAEEIVALADINKKILARWK